MPHLRALGEGRPKSSSLESLMDSQCWRMKYSFASILARLREKTTCSMCVVLRRAMMFSSSSGSG